MKDLKAWCEEHQYDVIEADNVLTLMNAGFNYHVQVTPNIEAYLISKLTKYTEVRCTECDSVIGYSHEWDNSQRRRCDADWNK